MTLCFVYMVTMVAESSQLVFDVKRARLGLGDREQEINNVTENDSLWEE